jgi:hypothetical protein
VFSYIAADCEDRVEVHLENAVPVVIWEVDGWVTGLYTGAVQEDVDLVVIG